MGLWKRIFGQYKFSEPRLYTGLKLRALRFLFVHIPESSLENSKVTDDFMSVVSDSAGAEFEKVFSHANVSYVTGSNMGDIVQRTKNLPDEVLKNIFSLYPETRDRDRYPMHVRTFKSAVEGRHGLLVFVYKAS